MQEDKILRTIFKYYPRNLDSVNQRVEYLNSREFKNLCELIEKHRLKKDDVIDVNFLKEICNDWGEFKDVTYFEWQDRCYSYEFNRQISSHEFVRVNLYSSIILPIYHIEYHTIKQSNSRFKFNKILLDNSITNKFILDIKTHVDKKGLYEIDSELLSLTINNINFDDIKMGSFTFFNALFKSHSVTYEN